MTKKTPEQIQKEIDRTKAKLQNVCKELGHTLYLDGTDEQGRLVYKIKEVPTFAAHINQVA